MNRLVAIGLALVVVGLLGYALGTMIPYAGRAFSVTAVMVGVTLVAVRGVGGEGGG